MLTLALYLYFKGISILPRSTVANFSHLSRLRRWLKRVQKNAFPTIIAFQFLAVGLLASFTCSTGWTITNTFSIWTMCSIIWHTSVLTNPITSHDLTKGSRKVRRALAGCSHHWCFWVDSLFIVGIYDFNTFPPILTWTIDIARSVLALRSFESVFTYASCNCRVRFLIL